MENKVTVIIPIYNSENTLKKCIDSVINQTYRDLEIILVDDGSTDNSVSICDKYAIEDTRIKTFHTINNGLSAARNFGIEQSLAPYLYFVDSDDYIELDAIEYLMDLLKKYDTDISCCDTFNDFPALNIIKPWHQDRDEDICVSAIKAVEDMFYSEHFDDFVWNKLYKRCVFENIRFPENQRQAEEAAITYKLLFSTEKIAIGMKCKYHYVMHDKGLSRTEYNPNQMWMQIAGLECINYVRENAPSIIKAAERRYVYDCFWVLRRILPVEKIYPNETSFLISEIKKYEKTVFFDKRTPKRDKIAIISLCFGKKSFTFAWNIYKKIRKH